MCPSQLPEKNGNLAAQAPQSLGAISKLVCEHGYIYPEELGPAGGSSSSSSSAEIICSLGEEEEQEEAPGGKKGVWKHLDGQEPQACKEGMYEYGPIET